MSRKYMIAVFAVVFMVSLAAGFFMGNAVMDIPELKEKNIYAAETTESEKVSGNVEKIVPSTKIIYEYYYPADGETESVEESAPYYMLGLTFGELKDNFGAWQIEYFSSEKVVMRRNVYGERQQKYIVGIKDGYVAVFYDIDVDEELVREITNIFAGALPEEEQKRLETGIKVVGESNLNGVLQDYSS